MNVDEVRIFINEPPRCKVSLLRFATAGRQVSSLKFQVQSLATRVMMDKPKKNCR